MKYLAIAFVLMVYSGCGQHASYRKTADGYVTWTPRLTNTGDADRWVVRNGLIIEGYWLGSNQNDYYSTLDRMKYKSVTGSAVENGDKTQLDMQSVIDVGDNPLVRRVVYINDNGRR